MNYIYIYSLHLHVYRHAQNINIYVQKCENFEYYNFSNHDEIYVHNHRLGLGTFCCTSHLM